MECYACTNAATRQCRRCARVYCEVHGADLCAECLNPASSLPSFNLYRGSLLALLVGTAVAVWLLVRPPGEGGEEQVVLQGTPSPAATRAYGTPTLERTTPAVRTATPGRTPTATPPVAVPTATAPQVYIVQEGDTLFSIAEQFAPPGVAIGDFAQQIADLNGFASIEDPIAPGQTLQLP